MVGLTEGLYYEPYVLVWVKKEDTVLYDGVIINGYESNQTTVSA